MRIWKTKKGNKIIQVLWGRSNAYLIFIDNNIILVDTGKTSAYNTLKKNIESLDITIADVSAIILTHTHFDHCQSTKTIKQKSDCQIIVSGSAANSIKNGYTKLPAGTIYVTRLIAKLGCLMGKRKFGYEPFEPDVFVNGNYDLTVANGKIKIIETPGHSADSISILVDNEIAIVGDVMFGVFKNSVVPPYSDDILRMIESWGKLLNMDCRIFIPGHGKKISRDLLEKEYEKYARKHNVWHKILT